MTKLKERTVRGKQLETGASVDVEKEKECLLIPELCNATGLTDQMRANFR